MNIEAVTDQDQPEQSSIDQNQAAPSIDMDAYLEEGYDYEAPKRGDIRSGVILKAHDRGLVVDIGFKREGLVPAEDLERLDEETRSEIAIGDEVPVFVLKPENKDGHPILSIHQARLYEDWLKAEQMMEDGELYEGEVAGFNRGGLIVRFGKIRGFVPASQVVGLPRRLGEDQRRQRLEAKIGEEVGLKIIEVDRRRRRLIFSQRRALRAWQEVQRKRVIATLTEGETRRGKVTSLTNFGAFVDLGGADGLIHVSELSWSRVNHPRDVLKVGQEVEVYVLDVDRKRKRIALSLKKLQPDPWTLVDDHYQVGQLVEGRVTRVLDFGAFIELDLGIEGLLHTSEMIGTPELPPTEIVHSGETLPVKIIRIESRRRRIALSARRVRKSEWERWVAEQQRDQELEEAAATAEVEEEVVVVEEEEAVAAPEPEAEASEQVEREEEAAPAGEPVADTAVAEEGTAEPSDEEEAEETESAIVSESVEEKAEESEAEDTSGKETEETTESEAMGTERTSSEEAVVAVSTSAEAPHYPAQCSQPPESGRRGRL